MMRRSCFLLVILVSALLFLSFTQGFGRVLMATDEHQRSTDMARESAGKFRGTLEVMDYADPQPNINPRNGFLSPPSPDYGPSPEP